jgi:hypothetical protein
VRNNSSVLSSVTFGPRSSVSLRSPEMSQARPTRWSSYGDSSRLIVAQEHGHFGQVGSVFGLRIFITYPWSTLRVYIYINIYRCKHYCSTRVPNRPSKGQHRSPPAHLIYELSVHSDQRNNFTNRLQHHQNVHPRPTALSSHAPVLGLHHLVYPLLQLRQSIYGYHSPH